MILYIYIYIYYNIFIVHDKLSNNLRRNRQDHTGGVGGREGDAVSALQRNAHVRRLAAGISTNFKTNMSYIALKFKT